MRLRILSADDVRAAMDMRSAIEAMREAFGQLSAGRARAPLRLPLESGHGTTLLMPAYLPDSGALASKVVSIFGANATRGLPAVTAVVLVLDAETGLPSALIEGTHLTAVRTGAASGLATALLAREDAAVATILGAGAQARTQLEAIRAVRPIREVRVVSRTRASAEAFAAEIRGTDARVVEDRTAAVRGADIIVTATTSATPVFPGAAVEAGTHVNGVGSYTPEMQEVDADLVRRARIVVDSRSGALAEAGDLIRPMREGLIGEHDLTAEIGEIVNGDAPGRTTPQEITFFKSVGHAVQDAAIGRRILATAEELGIGRLVAL